MRELLIDNLPGINHVLRALNPCSNPGVRFGIYRNLLQSLKGRSIMIKPSDFTRVNSDTNGNPRYVCWYGFMNTQNEKMNHYPENYAIACKRGNSLGGRKFHNKQYGGGIVFQSYSLQDTCNHINRLMQSIKG